MPRRAARCSAKASSMSASSSGGWTRPAGDLPISRGREVEPRQAPFDGGLGLRQYPLLVDPRRAAVPKDDRTVDDDGLHRAAARGERQLVHRVDARKAFGSVGAADDDIRTLADLQASDLGLEA